MNTPTSPRTSRHVTALDGMRAFAVSAVFLFHAFSSHKIYGRWTIVRFGNLGVGSFFVLSGFLIATRLFELAEAPPGTPRWRIFFLRRTARISPLYYLTLIALAVAGPWLGYKVFPGAWPWLFAYALNLFGFWYGGWVGAVGHFWSLCIEEQFYLFFPFLVLTRARRWLPPLTLLMLITPIALRTMAPVLGPRADWVWLLPPLHFDSFGAGIAAAICARDGTFMRARPKLLYGIGAVAGMVFCAHAFATNSPHVMTAIFPTAFANAAVVLALWNGTFRPLATVLQFKPIVALGRISYGFYVFHLFVIDYLWRFRSSWLPPFARVRGPIAFVISVVLATISWWALERPLLRLAHRWRSNAVRSNEPR